MPLKLVPRSPRSPHAFDGAVRIDALSPSAPDPVSAGTADGVSSTQAPRPPADLLPDRDMRMYGPAPLGSGMRDGGGLVKCARCGRATLEWAVDEHARICAHVLDGAPLTSKKVKVDRRESIKKRRASEITSSPPTPTKKQRLPDSDDEPLSAAQPPLALPLLPSGALDRAQLKGLKKSEVKKLVKEHERRLKREAKEKERLEIAERKRQRATGPIDLDRRCGVINDKGLPCSRSLTCKTHTVGAKRAVAGRSRPYDELHLEWQRVHNPNFKEPVKRDARAGAGVAAGAGAGAGGAAVAPRKKERRREYDDDDAGALTGEEGAREMELLLRAARVAGERVRTEFGASQASRRSATRSPAASLVNGSAGAPPSTLGGPALGARTGPWRPASFEQVSMGGLLTKALASRPVARVVLPLHAHAHGHAHGHGHGHGHGIVHQPAVAAA
ncbi:SAGA complex subunit Sgf73 [Cryptotrichosporon argae]